MPLQCHLTWTKRRLRARRELLQFLAEIEPDDGPIAIQVELIWRTLAPGAVFRWGLAIILNWCDALRRIKAGCDE